MQRRWGGHPKKEFNGLQKNGPNELAATSKEKVRKSESQTRQGILLECAFVNNLIFPFCTMLSVSQRQMASTGSDPHTRHGSVVPTRSLVRTFA